MKLNVSVTHKTVEEMDVEFPVYRKHDASDERRYIVYSRLDLISANSLGCRLVKIHRITQSGDGFEAEVSSMIFEANDSADYLLGRGEYASSQKEFDEVVAESRAFLQRFGA